jgi:hypothetical protein
MADCASSSPVEIVIVKHAPPSGPSETVMVPPWALAISAAIGRPRPEPA